MIHLESDYVAGAHPKVIEALCDTNLERLPGYGSDKYCDIAKEKINIACGGGCDVEFIAGGTQTNAVVIASMLADWQGVVSAVSGHINGHEAGAVEYTGKKVLPLPAHGGKIEASELSALLYDFHRDGNREHMVFPGMVYISYPTEYGTLYTKAELEAISSICREYKIPLFIDGARLGYGLASPACDITLPLLAELCDVFYIGGTKVGALCGEAVVFTKQNKPPPFPQLSEKAGRSACKRQTSRRAV